MKSKNFPYIAALLLSVLLGSVCGQAGAQQHPERRIIRSGNKSYDAQDYTGAEEKYRRALEKMPLSYEGAFNLSDALYRQKKYDESTALLKNLSENPTLSAQQRGKIFYNLGNNMFRQEKLQEAADYYKESLRANPSDMEAKYNLAYVNRLLDQQQNDKNDQNNEDNKGGNGNNGDNKQDDTDKNKDNRDNNNDDPDNGGDNQQDKGDGNQEKQNRDDKQQPENPEGGQQSKISRDNAESILNAIQQQEDNTREKVNQQKAVTVGRSGKNW